MYLIYSITKYGKFTENGVPRTDMGIVQKDRKLRVGLSGILCLFIYIFNMTHGTK